MNNKTYLFVDGNYLQQDYKKFAEQWFGTEGKLDFERIKEEFQADRNFYFDAADDINKFRDLQQSDWVVELGYVSSGRNRRQKEVDILMALRMISYAHKAKMNNVILLAGDGDFRPLAHELVKLDVDVKIVGDKKSINTQLLGEATSKLFIDIDYYYKWTKENIKATKPLEKIKNIELGQHQSPINPISTKKGTFDGDSITLIEKWENYFALVRSPQISEKFLWLECDNKEDLQTYFTLKFGEINWD